MRRFSLLTALVLAFVASPPISAAELPPATAVAGQSLDANGLRLLVALLTPVGSLPQDVLITTPVGTGQAGYSGDGGPATKAMLNQPFHCDLDGDGNLYIAEAFNHCIRKVDRKTGAISTVAGCGKKGDSGDGGPATAATMNEPYAVAVAANDDLYIVDRLNAVIRKVDGASGIMSTVAGNRQKASKGSRDRSDNR